LGETGKSVRDGVIKEKISEQVGGNKDFIAPMLFNGSLDAVTFERWLEVH